VCQSSSSSSSKIDEPIVHRNLSVGGSSLIVCEDDISIVQDNNRLNSFLSSNPNSRLSLPNIDYIQQLKREVEKLKRELIHTQESHRQKMEQLVKEEQDIRNENLRLQRKLQVEVDRREELYKQLSESESSLEMDEERALNQKFKLFSKHEKQTTSSSSSSPRYDLVRSRTASSPSFIINQNLEHLQTRRLTSNCLESNNHIE
ncbi:unnamed protein product, partial [Rotaria sordida]